LGISPVLNKDMELINKLKSSSVELKKEYLGLRFNNDIYTYMSRGLIDP